jgi:hypothetical protein
MAADEVLARIDHAGGTAAILHDRRGDVMLYGSLDDASGEGVNDHRPRHTGLPADRTALGGRLPDRAVTAEVLDDAGTRHPAAVGNGVWVAVLDQPIRGDVSPVCCRASDGSPVAAPLPASWDRQPVNDTDVPCRACHAIVWDEVRASDQSRGMSGRPGESRSPTPFAVCRACGQEQWIGSFHVLRSIGETLDPDEQAARKAAARRMMREGTLATLAGVTFPIYAIQGTPATLVGSGSSNGRTRELRIAHSIRGEPETIAQVQTLNDPSPDSEDALVRRALAGWLDENPRSKGRSHAARALARHASERAARQLAATAASEIVLIHLDGAREEFTSLRAGHRWAAVRRRAAETITITAANLNPAAITLAPLGDPHKDLRVEHHR